MDVEQIRQIILQELPGILQRDPEIQELIRRISRGHFADQAVTDSRFDRLLDELRQDREAESQRWAENQDELQRMWEEETQEWKRLREN